MDPNSNYRSYFRRMNQPPTLKELRKFEELIKVRLPPAYRKFLLACNGGIAEKRREQHSHWIFHSIAELSVDQRFKLLKERFLLPIADSEDNALYLDLQTGEAFLPGVLVYPSLEAFLSQACSIIVKDTDQLEHLIDNDCRQELEHWLDTRKPASTLKLGNGFSPSQFASVARRNEILKILLNYGFPTKGCLHLLLSTGLITRIEIEILLTFGADLQELNELGETVLEVKSPWISHVVDISNELKKC